MGVRVTIEFNNEEDAQAFRLHLRHEREVWIETFGDEPYYGLPATLVD